MDCQTSEVFETSEVFPSGTLPDDSTKTTMGRRGPAKTPAAVKKERGTYRKDRDAGVEVAAGEPIMPEWLDEAAQELWRELAPRLVKHNLLTPIDGVVFALFCDTFSMFRNCSNWIAGDIEKLFVESTRTNNDGEEIGSSVYQHPVTAIMHKSRNDLLRLAREFGMTPSSRSGMRIQGGNGEEDDDPIEQISKQFERMVGAKRN